MADDHEIFEAGDVVLQSGKIYPRARLAYKTYGALNAQKTNVVVYPTSFNAQHRDTQWLVRQGGVLDPTKYFVIIPNMFGNGTSSSPSHSPQTFDIETYPHLTITDNVRIQRRLLMEVFGVEKIALVYGFSMGGQQAFHWGALFPDMVERICAVCASAKTPVHNWVMLEGVKAALTADPSWNGQRFVGHAARGLQAFGRIFAGWALSQAFYRQDIYRQFGATSLEAFVGEWEAQALQRDGNDLLAQIWTWQHADIGANEIYGGDAVRALQAIRARTLAMPSETDLYFTVDDVRAEVAHIRGAELRPIPSVWGHRAGNPMKNPVDEDFIRDSVHRFLAS